MMTSKHIRNMFFSYNINVRRKSKSVLEAMSGGCIVIASNIENHTDIITDGENGYIIPNDCNSLDLFIESLLQNKKSYNKFL